MLKHRKDAGSGNVRTFYWNGRKIKESEWVKYWLMEMKRSDTELKYEQAKLQSLAAEYEQEIEVTKAMLAVQEAKLKKLASN